MPKLCLASLVPLAPLVTRYSLFTNTKTRANRRDVVDNAIWSLIFWGSESLWVRDWIWLVQLPLCHISYLVCVCECECVCVDNWVAKLQSERVCPYLGQAFLARMQCDTVTILMPNTYLITRSAKIWYPYRFFFLIFSPQCSSHFFSLIWFYFFLSLSYIYRIQMHVSVMPYKRC